MILSTKKKIFLLTCILLSNSVSAFVASSTNYVLQSDSMNFGGLKSDSTNYDLEDTFGDIGTGYSSSAAYELNAGYQQQSSSTISITSSGDVTLATIDGKAGSAGTKSASAWVAFGVTTDNPTGYSLFVKSAASPAFFSGSSYFPDYSPNGTVWTNGASESKFGFSVVGDNTITANNGLWFGFSTSDFKIAESTVGNNPAVSTTTVSLQAQVGKDMVQPAGNYSAHIIVTAVAN